MWWDSINIYLIEDTVSRSLWFILSDDFTVQIKQVIMFYLIWISVSSRNAVSNFLPYWSYYFDEYLSLLIKSKGRGQAQFYTRLGLPTNSFLTPHNCHHFSRIGDTTFSPTWFVENQPYDLPQHWGVGGLGTMACQLHNLHI